MLQIDLGTRCPAKFGDTTQFSVDGTGILIVLAAF